MSDQTHWIPDDIDQEQPSAARVYDYLLGGGSNFAVDRALAKQLDSVMPARQMARWNRAFLRRVVLYLTGQGIRQFIDLGSGIPTVGNVHDIARAADSPCRVLYVDHDAIAVAHSQLILENEPGTAVVQADFLDVPTVLASADGLLDLTQPVALLAIAVLHFVPDTADPIGVLGRYRDSLAPGSFLALSTVTADTMPASLASVERLVRGTPNETHPRTRDEVEALFAGFDLVDPGVVLTPLWRPERPDPAVAEDAARSNFYACVATKP